MEKELDREGDALAELDQHITEMGAVEVLRLTNRAITIEDSERAEKEARDRRARVEHARWVHDHPWGNQI